jgi:hypothetical protein
MSKRTATVTFELTKHQSNQIQALGHALWPNQHLHRDEICRRVLLDATDRTLPSADGERLLEPGCQPSQRPSKTENQKSILMAVRS